MAVIGGFVALTRVPIQLTPDIQRPVVNVTTIWPGASPEEIEKEIVQEQEEYLKSIEGLLEMTSESSDGRGAITLEFAVGTDIVGATVNVTNKLNEVRRYPENAERPIVSSSGRFDNVIGWFVVGGDSGIYVPHYKALIEDVVRPRLERVEGVSKINVFGGLEEELHVDFDPDMLASSGITIKQLAAALRAENRDISGGDFGEGKRRYVVRTVSRFETIEAVAQTVVAVRDGVPVRVRDIAEVSLGFEKQQVLVRGRGEPSISFNVQRRLGTNVLQVMENLNKQLEIVNREILNPRGMHADNVYTESVYIESSIDLVISNILFGGLLAVLVLFVFLRSPSSIFVIACAIPISIISSFLVMTALGRTVNVISLAGMAFAVGMVVDNAIVVLENIYRHLQMNKNKWQAAIDGTREVWGAVLASTVTTVAVFLPILFIQERAGQLFRDIAIAISSAIVVSLIVSVTVIPSLSSRILKIHDKFKKTDQHGNWINKLASRISNFVDSTNARPKKRLLVMASIVAVSVGLTFLLLPDSEYLPNGNRNLVFGMLMPPPGYNQDEMLNIAHTIEGQLKHLWETPVEDAKELPGGGVYNFFFVAFRGFSIMGMAANDASRARELVPVANGALRSVPGAYGFASQSSLFGRGLSGSRSVRIDVTGPELPEVLALAGEVFGKVGEILPGANSRPDPGLDLGNPEVRVIPDRIRAADMGFSAADIGSAVNALVDGMKVGDYRFQGRNIDLLIRGRDDLSRHTQDIAQLPLATPSGDLVTIGDIAEVIQQQGPVEIKHVERQRAVSIETVLPDDIPLEEAIRLIEEELIRPMREQGRIGGLYNIETSGTADDLSRLRAALGLNFLAAIVLTYLLLAALFQSFTYPIVIMLTVPLATFGGVLGLRVVQLFDPLQQLDILTMLGFVILVGTVINNSILIVHHALHLMKESDWSARDAVRESVRVRVRPIFMSTGTSALGMLPLVIMPGAGSELYRGLGSVVIGGLALSSVITLALTPLVFSYVIELQTKARKLFGMDKPVLEPAPEV
jgi:HAE1 family hydrophobic/amphiphilic exporter-1